MNLRKDAWLAGFVDGEGCFLIAPRPNGFIVRFSIGLRADDLAILKALRSEFGGRIYIVKGQNRDHPRAQWSIDAKRDLLGLVAYFDAFPLRAKKVRDYALWRRAVLAYARDGVRSPDLPLLAEALSSTKGYESDIKVSARPDPPQLSLVEDVA